MKRYIKRFVFILFLISIFFLSGIYLISKNENDLFAKTIKDKTPYIIKKFLKETIFYIPIELREKKKLEKENMLLLKDFDKLNEQNKVLKNKINKGKYEIKTIENFKMESFILPYIVDEKKTFLNKKTGYLGLYKDKLFVFFTSGKIIYFDKKNFNSKNFEFKQIKNDLINSNYFNNKIKWTGVRDILIDEEDIYISITDEKKTDCYSTSILHSKINFNFMKFEKIFKDNECVHNNKYIKGFKYFNGYQTGGRIVKKNNFLYLTIGDYNDWQKPQNIKSIIGKVIEINLENKNFRVVSLGHRNPQGLQNIENEENYLILTEHGPKGGDEINIIDIKKINNYGWPLASYGDHYDKFPLNHFTNKYAPLKKSHKKNNFEEPIYYFKNSIGISEIIKDNFSNDEHDYFVTSLKNKAIYKFNTKNKSNDILKKIEVGERIRDIIYDNNSGFYYLYLEDSPVVVRLSRS